MRIHNAADDTTFSVDDATDILSIKQSIQERTGVSIGHQKV